MDSIFAIIPTSGFCYLLLLRSEQEIEIKLHYLIVIGLVLALTVGCAVPTPAPSPTPDTTPPDPPMRLTSTAYSSTQIDLSWFGSEDNVGVAGYKIFRDGEYIQSVITTSFSDTDIEPFLVSSALVGVVAQRMVRRICPDCARLVDVPLIEQMTYSKETGEERGEFLYGSGCKIMCSYGVPGTNGNF